MTLTYDPLFTLKPVAGDIWIVDGPPVTFFGAPFPTRMTVVRLADGGLWIHSPIAWRDELAETLGRLGPVRHLIAPNWIHYLHIATWKGQFPEALSWAAPGVAERARSRGHALQFDRDLDDAAPEDWASDLRQMLVRGSDLHREVVFFHIASRTLILTDLIENFERAKLPWWMRPLARLAGILDPDGKSPMDMAMSFRKGRDDLRACVEEMIRWSPERIIIAHGRWYQRNGVAELRRAFRNVLS